MSTKTITYGSITIVDITDVGEFSIYPMSNSPLSVIYDPNQNTYAPDWSTNNLVLQPMVYYAGKKLDSNTQGLSVSWKRKDGIGADSALESNETVSSHNLKVSANKLSSSSSGILTYICTATYVEPESKITLTATGQITFSLIKHAADVKKCSITGENVFKYNTNGVLTNANEGGYLILTAVTDNVSITRWQYKNSSGAWVDYPVKTGQNASNTEETLNVYSTETSVFVNDVATIRVNTNDDSVYDIITMVKLKDGAPGSATVSAVLTNDDQWIPCDGDGNPTSGAFANAKSTITIFEGGVDVTSTWTIECTPTNAVGFYDSSTSTYSVTSISNDSANIEFKCTKTGYDPIYKNFSLTKLTAGKDGKTPIIYSISSSTLATNRTIAGVYTPESVTFDAHSQDGSNDKVAYSGRFKIFADNVLAYTSLSNESSYTYTFAGTNLKSLRCELYKSGGTTDKVDSQTIVVTSDGATGAQGGKGDDGEAATNVVLGNQADIIPCNNDGSVKSEMTLTIPFTGYLGTSKAACTVAVSGLPSGITVKTKTDGTTSANGKLELSVAPGSKLGEVNSGTITLTFTCNGTTILHYYQWSKSIQAINGVNAVLFEIYAPTGNIINNGANNVTLQTRLMDGSSDKTSSATYQWKKYSNGTYNEISGATNSLIEITPNDVSGYASYQCVAKYNTKTYTAYYAVMDKSDPVQAQVYCSLGTQILNGQGYGAVYTKIFRNGEEIDAIKSERFLTTTPQDVGNGFYYHLDTSSKTATLKKRSGTSWVNASGDDLPKATYNYTFRDKDGNVTTYNNNSTVVGKVFYVDGTLIDKKIVIDVEVTI